jgi:hypothetical protein
MIIFHRHATCSFCDDVQEKLEEMVLAHRIVETEEPEPFLLEGKQTYRGKTAITQLVNEVAAEVATSRIFQSDACYIDPESGDPNCII